jgi:hypothetical protein
MGKIMWGILENEKPIRYTRASISFFEMPCIIWTFFLFFFLWYPIGILWVLVGCQGGKIFFLTKIHWFLLPQANGCTCVNFGCTHPIDGLFWNLPLYFLGFFSKYECWVIDLIVPLISFYFVGLSLCLLYHEVSYH